MTKIEKIFLQPSCRVYLSQLEQTPFTTIFTTKDIFLDYFRATLYTAWEIQAEK